MHKLRVILVLMILSVAGVTYADRVPVEELSQEAAAEQPSEYDQSDYESAGNEDVDSTRTSFEDRKSLNAQRSWSARNSREYEYTELSAAHRIEKVERQIENLNKLNLIKRLEQLQDELNQIRGQFDKQEHDIQTLAMQQKQFYQDLNARISQQPKAVQTTTASPANDSKESVEAQKNEPISAIESQFYREAFDLLKAKQYDQAISAFQRYLSHYPTGHYAVNGNYWLGEIYYLQGRAVDAKKAFTAVVKNYPDNQKMPDALLKLAIIEIESGNKAEGQKLLEQVQQQYPGTTAARLAGLRYQELRLSS